MKSKSPNQSLPAIVRNITEASEEYSSRDQIRKRADKKGEGNPRAQIPRASEAMLKTSKSLLFPNMENQ